MKKAIHRTLNRLGYDIHRLRDIRDLDTYVSLYSEESLEARRFYNVGAGDFSHPFWTNIDYDSEWYARNREKTLRGVSFDLLSLEPLPIEANRAEIVYSSQTFEHITDEAVRNLLEESYRILKPGAHLRIVLPDVDLAFRALRDNDRRFFQWIEGISQGEAWKEYRYLKPLTEASIEQVFLTWVATSVSTLHADGAEKRLSDAELWATFDELEYEEALNRITGMCPIEVQRKYPGNHINWWNEKKLDRMLKAAGFKEVRVSGFGQSYCPILRNTDLFDCTYPKMSFFMEAVKASD